MVKAIHAIYDQRSPSCVPLSLANEEKHVRVNWRQIDEASPIRFVTDAQQVRTHSTHKPHTALVILLFSPSSFSFSFKNPTLFSRRPCHDFETNVFVAPLRLNDSTTRPANSPALSKRLAVCYAPAR